MGSPEALAPLTDRERARLHLTAALATGALTPREAAWVRSALGRADRIAGEGRRSPQRAGVWRARWRGVVARRVATLTDELAGALRGHDEPPVIERGRPRPDAEGPLWDA